MNPWIAALQSTDPVERERVEALIEELYESVGLARPESYLWHASPIAALRTFAELQRTGSAGRWQVMEPPGADGGSLIFRVMQQRVPAMMEVAGMQAYLQHAQTIGPEWQPLQALERQVFGHFGDGTLAYGAARSGASDLRHWLGATPYQHYGVTQMARDEQFCAAHGAAPTRSVQLLWDIAKRVPVWWPFARAVVLSDRPVQIDGATFTYADGFVAAPYVAAVRKTASKAAKDAKVLSVELPHDSAERIALLRKHAGSLPRFERYVGGKFAEVWKELVELGPAVRSEAHAADALAVAYETMSRVGRNIEILTGKPTPVAKNWKLIQKLDKKVGPLPLSLRAFYDVIGEVDLSAMAWPEEDPLVVWGPNSAWEEYESEEDSFDAVTIAPDALHKANVSGGDPYTIALPCALADAPLEAEPHEVNFVEYLRLNFPAGVQGFVPL